MWCRRYKLDCDKDLVYTIRSEDYNDPQLHTENLVDDGWYWVDLVPFFQDEEKFTVNKGLKLTESSKTH